MMAQPGGRAATSYGGPPAAGREPGGNLGDILERVLDKGLVIAGDIRVNLLDIELLTIKLRLVIASVQTARELGINWWETDPWLTSDGPGRRQLEEENRQLRARLSVLEPSGTGRRHRAGSHE
jgi:hypothetical protein